MAQFPLSCAHVTLCFYFYVCRFLLQNKFMKLVNIFVFFVSFSLTHSIIFSFSNSIDSVSRHKLRKKIFGDRLPLRINFSCRTRRVIPSGYVWVIDQGQDGWILAELLFCVFMDRDGVEVNKHAKKERGQYQAILTEQAWSVKDLLYVFRGNFS